MKKTDASFRFTGDDAKLLQEAKKQLLSAHGKLSNIAVLRQALIALIQSKK